MHRRLASVSIISLSPPGILQEQWLSTLLRIAVSWPQVFKFCCYIAIPIGMTVAISGSPKNLENLIKNVRWPCVTPLVVSAVVSQALLLRSPSPTLPSTLS